MHNLINSTEYQIIPVSTPFIPSIHHHYTPDPVTFNPVLVLIEPSEKLRISTSRTPVLAAAIIAVVPAASFTGAKLIKIEHDKRSLSLLISVLFRGSTEGESKGRCYGDSSRSAGGYRLDILES